MENECECESSDCVTCGYVIGVCLVKIFLCIERFLDNLFGVFGLCNNRHLQYGFQPTVLKPNMCSFNLVTSSQSYCLVIICQNVTYVFTVFQFLFFCSSHVETADGRSFFTVSSFLLNRHAGYI
jgi:hypothetical protein